MWSFACSYSFTVSIWNYSLTLLYTFFSFFFIFVCMCLLFLFGFLRYTSLTLYVHFLLLFCCYCCCNDQFCGSIDVVALDYGITHTVSINPSPSFLCVYISILSLRHHISYLLVLVQTFFLQCSHCDGRDRFVFVLFNLANESIWHESEVLRQTIRPPPPHPSRPPFHPNSRNTRNVYRAKWRQEGDGNKWKKKSFTSALVRKTLYQFRWIVFENDTPEWYENPYSLLYKIHRHCTPNLYTHNATASLFILVNFSEKLDVCVCVRLCAWERRKMLIY